jgi:hypothetical protein
MNGKLAKSLGVTLGLMTAMARADDIEWRAVKPTSPVARAAAEPPPPASTTFPTHAGAVQLYPSPRPGDLDPPTIPSAFKWQQPWHSAKIRAQTADPKGPDIKVPHFKSADPKAKLPKSSEPKLAEPKPGELKLEKIAPHRDVKEDSKTGKPEPILAGSDVPMTLIGEYGCGEQPPPIEPGIRTWARAEYLMWWTTGMRVPPLATMSLMPGVNPPSFGFFGDPFTRVLLGDTTHHTGMRNGGRFTFGCWFNECQQAGIDGSYFFLGQESQRVTVSPNQFPSITRPILVPNIVNGAPLGEFGELVTFPNISTGSLSVKTSTYFWGADANIRETLWCCKGCDWGRRAEVFTGFRYLSLDETMLIRENPTSLVPTQDVINGVVVTSPAGTQRLVSDDFLTHNQFYGWQLGVDWEWRRERWSLSARTAVALGDTHQTLVINGSTTQIRPGAAPMAFNGGLLASQTNIGRHTRDVFSVSPEVRVNLGYQVTRGIRAFVGYNFLYWSNVIRPGDQIDRVVDVALLPIAPTGPGGLPIPPSGQARPTVLFNSNDYWAQGLNFGMELRW